MQIIKLNCAACGAPKINVPDDVDFLTPHGDPPVLKSSVVKDL